MIDQLVLGIKGTLSVVELEVLRMRMLRGMEEKAARGELESGSEYARRLAVCSAISPRRIPSRWG